MKNSFCLSLLAATCLMAGTAAQASNWRLNASPHSDKMGAPNHSPEFMIDEKALRIGTRALVASSLTYMMENKKP